MNPFPGPFAVLVRSARSPTDDTEHRYFLAGFGGRVVRAACYHPSHDDRRHDPTRPGNPTTRRRAPRGPRGVGPGRRTHTTHAPSRHVEADSLGVRARIQGQTGVSGHRRGDRLAAKHARLVRVHARERARRADPLARTSAPVLSRPTKPCPACPPGARRCCCDALEARADRAANEWARAHGCDALPTRDSARFLGGNHERSDRGAPQDHLRRFETQRADRRELGAYLEVLELRIAATDRRIGADQAERSELDRSRSILRMYLDGVHETEIAEAFGRRSHSWASEWIAKIRAEARASRERGSVATPCRCGRVGCIVTAWADTGRPRKYRTESCAALARQRARRGRLRVSVTVSVTRGRGGHTRAPATPAAEVERPCEQRNEFLDS